MYNIHSPGKDIRLRDPDSKVFELHDKRFHICQVIPKIVNYLTNDCGFAYMLTGFLQNGVYRLIRLQLQHIHLPNS